MSRPVIDFHTHCYPEKVAEKAIAAVGVHGLHPDFDATLPGLLESMRRAGITASLNLPLVNSPENTRGVNQWAARNNQAPIYSLGSIHPADPHPAETLAWVRSLGLKGIKMHPEYQQFSFNDPSLEPIWQGCIDNDLFLLTHGGADIAFAPPPMSDPVSLAAFHRRYPSLKLVIAHLGSWGMWQETRTHLVGLPVYLDLAFVCGMIPDDELVAIIRAHGAERILFGTDAPWRSQKETLDHFLTLDLSTDAQDNILYNNAVKLLGL